MKKQPENASLAQYAEKALYWLEKKALPFWANEGIDSQSGGFHERIDLTGKAEMIAGKRLLVQGRQIYTYSHASAIGIYDGLNAVKQSIDFIDKYGWSKQGGWVHKLEPNGHIKDSKIESYDQSFLLLALGWYNSQQKDIASTRLIQKTLDYIDKHLQTTQGYHESLPDRQQPRRQNPHMHFFEAFLELYCLTGEQHYLDRSHAIFHLFETVFFDSQEQVIREFFTSDWQYHQQTYQRIEPGHLMEWVWLLHQYKKLYPKAEVDKYCRTLFHKAMAIGYHEKNGVLLDCVSPNGEVIISSSRCWPQTEGVKAALLQYQHTGDKYYYEICQTLLSSIFNRYLSDCPAGGWRDVFDADMNSIAKTMPASSLYHIFVCFQQLIELHHSNR